MGGERNDATLALRISAELRERLEAIADREMRTLSKVTVRAIELGLDVMEARGELGHTPQMRGEAFEQAVLAILESNGLLRKVQKPEAEKKLPKVVGMEPKKIGKKKTIG